MFLLEIVLSIIRSTQQKSFSFQFGLLLLSVATAVHLLLGRAGSTQPCTEDLHN